jgi:translation initiation factor 4A
MSEFLNTNQKSELNVSNGTNGTNEQNEFHENNNSVIQIYNKWEDLDLDPYILRGVFSYGFEIPSPIQQKAIKPIIDGRDIIAQAQSGTGKTATFTIGALHRVNIKENSTQVLILSPTRELATQTTNVINELSNFMNGLKIETVIGGSELKSVNTFSNKNTPHIICGCPGRVYDMICRSRINSNTIKLIILDEADEMLSSGFKEQVYNIFQTLNEEVQIGLFSATLPDSVNSITSKIMRNPVKICVNREQLTLEGIRQYYVAADSDPNKYLILKNMFSYFTLSHTIIYCNSIKRVQDLYEAMRDDEFPVCRIHGTMTKQERDESFQSFRSGSSRVLISSNVTARGIDIQQVSIVINFDVPKCVHNYLHRIGRSGRWGRKGIGINFITRRDIGNLKRIEEHYATQINEIPEDLSFLGFS